MSKKHLLFLFVLIGTLNVTAQKVTLKFKNTELKQVFSEINKQTGYTFSYSTPTVDTKRKVSIITSNEELNSVLKKIFTKTNITYEITNEKKIILKVKKGVKIKSSNNKVVKSKFKENNSDVNQIEGKVSDNMGPVPGASVLVKGTTNGTTTDFDGNFTLTNVPKNTIIQISYMGYKTIELPSNSNFSNIILKEDAQTLEEVVIVGQQLSNLKAIKTKRQNVTIIDAISSDEVGSLPDDNVGDALRRIPGVSQKGDQGETRFVSVRGLNPDYNMLMVNGSRIAVPDRNGRRVFLDVLPSSLSKELQTVKTFTANLDAGGVGAHINLVPRSAFDYNGKMYFKIYGRGGFYENYNGPSAGKPSIKSDMIFAWKPGTTDKLGVLIAADYYKRHSYTDHLENSGRINWFRVSDNASLSPIFTKNGRKLEKDGTIYNFSSNDIYAAPDGINRFLYLNNRERIGLSAVIDYKVNGNSKFKFMQFYNEGTDDEARWGNRFISDANRIYGTKTSGFIDFQHRLEIGKFDFTRQVWGSQISYEHIFDRSSLTVKGSYSGSKFFNDENFFRFTTTDTGNGSALRYNYHYDISNRNALLTPTSSKQYNNLDNYVMRGFANFQELRELKENVFESQIDYENNINKDGLGYQFGIKSRQIDRAYDEDQVLWTPTDMNNWKATNYVGNTYTPELLGISNQNTMFIIDEEKVINNVKNKRNKTNLFTKEFRTPRSNERDYGVTESILAGYGMLTHKGEKHYLNVGLRVENTKFNGKGRKQVEGNNKNWKDAENSGSYFKWLPSTSFYYNITDKFKVRMAYSRSLGRPDFISFTPRGESLRITEADGQDEIKGSRGNPDLKPRESNNFDASFEYYMGKNKELISLGIFHKNIKNEFFRMTQKTTARLDGQTLPAYITQYNNLENNVKLTGIEFNLIKDFDFLPGFLSGFGTQINALYIINPKVLVPNTSGIDANNDGLNDLMPYTELDGLLEQSNQVVNASLYYQKGKFKTRLAYHYSGSFLDGINTSNPERNKRQLGRSIVDVKMEYKLNKSINLFFLGQNLTDSGRRIDYDIPGSSNYSALVKRDYGSAFFVGLSYRIRKY